MNKTELRKIIRKVVDETLWQREGKGCKHKKKKKWESKGEDHLNEGNDKELQKILKTNDKAYKRLTWSDKSLSDGGMEDLYDDLYWLYHVDRGEMPKNIARGKSGEPQRWIEDKLEKLGLLESKGGNLECQECGKKFRKANPTINTKCPKCGSHDLELSEVKSESAKRDYKDEYKKFQSSEKAKKYRAELNRYNREKGTYGNGDGKDASHKGGKIVGFEKESTNRGRREKSRLKKEEVLNESLGNFLDRTLGNLDHVIIALYQEKHIDDKQFKMLQKYLIKVMKKLDVTLSQSDRKPPRGWKGSHLREIAERIMQEKYTGNLGKEVAETVKNFEMCINELHRLKYITTDEWRHHFVHYPKWFDRVFKKWLKGKGLQGY